MRITAIVLLLLVLSPFTRPFKTFDVSMAAQLRSHCLAPAAPQLNRNDSDSSAKVLLTRQWHAPSRDRLVVAMVPAASAPVQLRHAFSAGHFDSGPLPDPPSPPLSSLRI
jgi:hypothetical protein